MSRAAKFVIGLLVLAALLLFSVHRLQQRREDRAAQIVADVSGCDVYERHRELLRSVIASEHGATYARHDHRMGGQRMRGRSFDWDGYRTDMYNTMVRALHEQGHEADAIALDRCRARGG